MPVINCKEIREQKGFSQGELSRRSGVPQPVIWSIENEQTKSPRYDTIKKLAQALGVSIDELMNDEGRAAV